MKLHANARTCPKSCRLLVRRVDGVWSLAAAARLLASAENGGKWVARWRAEGAAGLFVARRCVCG